MRQRGPDPLSRTRERIPVTVLTGFLGAGKTTTLNRLLKQSEERIAVLVNEFGEIAVDGALIRKSEGQIIELNNGCVCCTIRGDMQESMRSLLRKRQRRWFRTPFDRVVVETSGMAEPGPLLQTFTSDPMLAELTEVTGVVTLTHAALIVEQLDAYPEALAQVSCADLLVLNHTDRVQSTEPARRALSRRNPIARLHETQRGVVPLGDLLNTNRLELPPTTSNHRHSDVESISLTSLDPVCEETLTMWLRSLIVLRDVSILRLKGVFRVKGREEALVVQGVDEWLEAASLDAPAPDESSLVLIGRNLSVDTLRRGWQAVIDA